MPAPGTTSPSYSRTPPLLFLNGSLAGTVSSTTNVPALFARDCSWPAEPPAAAASTNSASALRPDTQTRSRRPRAHSPQTRRQSCSTTSRGASGLTGVGGLTTIDDFKNYALTALSYALPGVFSNDVYTLALNHCETTSGATQALLGHCSERGRERRLSDHEWRGHPAWTLSGSGGSATMVSTIGMHGTALASPASRAESVRDSGAV